MLSFLEYLPKDLSFYLKTGSPTGPAKGDEIHAQGIAYCEAISKAVEAGELSPVEAWAYLLDVQVVWRSSRTTLDRQLSLSRRQALASLAPYSHMLPQLGQRQVGSAACYFGSAEIFHTCSSPWGEVRIGITRVSRAGGWIPFVHSREKTYESPVFFCSGAYSSRSGELNIRPLYEGLQFWGFEVFAKFPKAIFAWEIRWNSNDAPVFSLIRRWDQGEYAQSAGLRQGDVYFSPLFQEWNPGRFPITPIIIENCWGAFIDVSSCKGLIYGETAPGTQPVQPVVRAPEGKIIHRDHPTLTVDPEVWFTFESVGGRTDYTPSGRGD